mmetsp:Transcript_86404/g.230823  ORF Transcript_86404/g.230823 Transcript_86404/m.230823 type:complete len:348 (-) Transcript_86404:563-1606(-)
MTGYSVEIADSKEQNQITRIASYNPENVSGGKEPRQALHQPSREVCHRKARGSENALTDVGDVVKGTAEPEEEDADDGRHRDQERHVLVRESQPHAAEREQEGEGGLQGAEEQHDDDKVHQERPRLRVEPDVVHPRLDRRTPYEGLELARFVVRRRNPGPAGQQSAGAGPRGVRVVAGEGLRVRREGHVVLVLADVLDEEVHGGDEGDAEDERPARREVDDDEEGEEGADKGPEHIGEVEDVEGNGGVLRRQERGVVDGGVVVGIELVGAPCVDEAGQHVPKEEEPGGGRDPVGRRERNEGEDDDGDREELHGTALCRLVAIGVNKLPTELLSEDLHGMLSKHQCSE